MTPACIVYEDGIVAVGLFAEDGEADRRDLLHLGMRWLPPMPCRGKNGEPATITNIMGGETDWFLLPQSFGAAAGRRLVEQHAAGLEGFDESGYRRLVRWLVADAELSDSMCY